MKTIGLLAFTLVIAAVAGQAADATFLSAAHAQESGREAAPEEPVGEASAGQPEQEQRERIFPIGLGIGLVPPPGMQLAERFTGFADEARESAILLAELPPELFAALEKDLREPAEEPEGFKLISREAWPVDGGKGILVVASQMADGQTIYKWVLVRGTPASAVAVTFQVSDKARDYYTDEVVRRALRSVGGRDHASIMAEVKTLPFVIDETLDDDQADDRTGFRITRVAPGGSAMLTNGPKDLVQGAEQPVIVVGGGRAAIVGRLEQDQFARQAFTGLGGLRDMRVRRGEGVTRDGVDWHEIEAEGQDARSGARVRVIQAVRFDRSDFIRFVLIARDDAYEDSARFFDRLRASVTVRPGAAAASDADPADQ